MKINKYKDQSASQDSKSHYTMIKVTPKEALQLILSLAGQLEANSSNKNRLESKINDGPFKGHLSIAVDYEDICIQCGKEIPPIEGKFQRAGYLCDEHETHGEIYSKKLLSSISKPNTKRTK